MTELETSEAWKRAKSSLSKAAMLGMGQYDPKRETPELDAALREAAALWLDALDAAAQWVLNAKGAEKVRAARTMGTMIAEGDR
jgi:hypothetical protein